MTRFVNFKDFKGQPIVVNAEQVIFVRSFGSLAKTEIAFAAAQSNQALCVVVEGTVENVTRQLDGGFAISQAPSQTVRASGPPIVGPRRLVASCA